MNSSTITGPAQTARTSALGSSSTGAEQAADESILISRLKAGEETAFEEILRAHAGHLLAVARKYLPEESDSEDAVQDAMLSAIRAIGTFEGSSRLSTWLHRITVNACLMKLRTRRRRPEKSIESLLPQFVEDGHQKNPSTAWKPVPAGGIEGDEVRAIVRSKIAELPDNYRVVLLLRDVEGLSTEEAATVLGISANALKTRLHRAHQALRGLLDPYFREG